VVETFDEHGHKIDCGGATVEVNIICVDTKVNDTAIDVVVMDNGNGTYSCAYEPSSYGRHAIRVDVNGGSLPGSPYSVDVRERERVHPPNCTAHGDGLSSGWTDSMMAFSVLTYDQYGDRFNGSGSELTVTATCDLGIVHCRIAEASDGEYQVEWEPIGRGTYRVDVCVNGAPIARSPFAAKVKLRGVDALKSIVGGAGISKATAGNMQEVAIKLRDEDGQPIELGSDPSQALHVRVCPPHAPVGEGHGTAIEVIFEGDAELTWTDQSRTQCIDEVASALRISSAQISLIECLNEDGFSKPGAVIVADCTDIVLLPFHSPPRMIDSGWPPLGSLGSPALVWVAVLSAPVSRQGSRRSCLE
jgi:hypothetical protein